MDFKVFITTFWMIFMAEMGDKTQLAAITMVSSTKKPLEVFLGASIALATVTLVGVLFGEGLMKVVPEHIIHTGAGVIFVVIGALMIFGKF